MIALELRRLLNEATPLPWRARKWPSPTRMVEVIPVAMPKLPIVPWTGFDDSSRIKAEHDANAALIAAAVNALPDLLAIVDAARYLIDVGCWGHAAHSDDICMAGKLRAALDKLDAAS